MKEQLKKWAVIFSGYLVWIVVLNSFLEYPEDELSFVWAIPFTIVTVYVWRKLVVKKYG